MLVLLACSQSSAFWVSLRTYFQGQCNYHKKEWQCCNVQIPSLRLVLLAWVVSIPKGILYHHIKVEIYYRVVREILRSEHDEAHFFQLFGTCTKLYTRWMTDYWLLTARSFNKFDNNFDWLVAIIGKSPGKQIWIMGPWRISEKTWACRKMGWASRRTRYLCRHRLACPPLCWHSKYSSGYDTGIIVDTW